MQKKWGLWISLSLLLPSSVILGIHALIGTYNRYIADDFCSAHFASRLGFFRSAWFWYITWSGRFSASLADGILPLIGIHGLTVSVLIILIIWLVILTLAIISFSLNRPDLKSHLFVAFSFSAASIFVTLLISPNVVQSLYWWGGMRAYIPPLLLATLDVLVFQLFERKKRAGIDLYVWFGLSFVIALGAGGFNETFAPVQVIFFVLALGLGLVIKKIRFINPTLLFVLAGLLGSLLAVLLVMLAPGNANRQSFFPASHNIFNILNISLTSYLVFLKGITSTFGKIAGMAAIALASVWMGMQSPSAHSPKLSSAYVALIAGLIFAFGCFPSAAYGLSDAPPARTLIIPAYFIVISLLVSGFILGQGLSQRFAIRHSTYVNFGFCAGVTVLMLFSAWTNGRMLFSTRQQYIDYASQWDQVNIQITRARDQKEKSAVVPPMPNWAGLDYPNDNPKFWVNYCYSSYYGITVVTAAPVQYP